MANNASHLHVCIIYRPKAEKLTVWSENFEQELDNAFIENTQSNLICDLDKDSLQPDNVPGHWNYIVEAFLLTPGYTNHTGVTETARTLLDHMYVTVLGNIRKCHVCKYSMNVYKVRGKKGTHLLSTEAIKRRS